MKFTLIKQDTLSGSQAGIYSVKLDEEDETLLERFVRENQIAFADEVTDILLTLKTIGHATGAREKFFKPKEGKPGDGIEALYDPDRSHLRLYCIRNGRVAVIVGGGGVKNKAIRAWQEDARLSAENKLLQLVSKTMTKALLAQDLQWSQDGTDLLGNLTIDTADYQ